MIGSPVTIAANELLIHYYYSALKSIYSEVCPSNKFIRNSRADPGPRKLFKGLNEIIGGKLNQNLRAD